MSLVDRINQSIDLRQGDFGFIRDYGYIFALICMALAVLVASAIFTPAPVGSGIANELTTTGL